MIVLGLDLSLRATGIVVVPVGWGLDFKNVYASHAGLSVPKKSPPSQYAKRLILIRDTVRSVVRSYKPTIAVIENYAFGAVWSACEIGELGGVIKTMLHEEKIPFQLVMPSSARRLLGKQPKAGSKEWAAAKLYAAGAPRLWTDAELDAFVVANWHLAEHGAALILTEAA